MLTFIQINYIKVENPRNYSDSVIKVTTKVVNPDLAAKCNYKGRFGKIPFEKYAYILETIYSKCNFGCIS